MMKKILLLLLANAAFALNGTVALAAPEYHLIKKVALGGAYGNNEYFDYVTIDSAARRVYLTHGTEVIVLDADTFSVVGTISGLKRCHGVLVLPELGKGFITDGDAAQVVVVDLKTLKTTGKIKTFPDTDSIVYDSASRLVFTFNGDSKNATAIDPVKETVVKVIEMGGAPEYPVSDGKGRIYDAIEDNNEVAVVDTHAFTISHRWPVAPAGSPVGMGMDRDHQRLFCAGRNPQFLNLMDADDGRIIQSLPISSGVDANIFEPATGLLFISTREGKIHIFHEESPDRLTEVQTVTTEYGAKTMNLDSKTHRLFLTTANFRPPPAPTKAKAAPQRSAIPGTFHVLIYGR